MTAKDAPPATGLRRLLSMRRRGPTAGSDRQGAVSVVPSRRFLAITATMALILMMMATFAVPAWGGPKGDDQQGTVKIHEGAGEPDPVQKNEPKVCTFHIHGFNFHDGEQIVWWIEEKGEQGWGDTVLSGNDVADSDGEWRDPDGGTHTLPEGHYKLHVDRAPEFDPPVKHKVFKVECEAEVSPTSTIATTTTAPTTTTVPTTTTAPTTTTTAPTTTTTSGQDQMGTLQIKKHSTDDPEFDFTFTGPSGEFTLSNNESFFFEGLIGVEYTFTEIVPEGWYLEDIECDDDDGNAVIDLENNTVTMVVTDPGSPFKCDFDNEELPEGVSPAELPDIDVTKTPDVDEASPEDMVTFTFVISNPSETEPVEISSIVDSVFGPLAGDADCQVGVVLAPSASCQFTFVWTVTGDDSGTHENIVEVIGVDVENPELTVEAEAEAVVEVSEVAGIGITAPTSTTPGAVGPVTPVESDVAGESADVLAAQVEAEQLPFTGMDTGQLVALSLLLLGVGALLVTGVLNREEG